MEYKGYRHCLELLEDTGEFRHWIMRLEDEAEWPLDWTAMPTVEQFQAYVDANFS